MCTLAGLTTLPWLPWQRHSKTGEGGERRRAFFLSSAPRGGVRFLLLGWTKIAVSHPRGSEPSQHSSSSSSDSSSLLFPLFLFSLFLSFSFFHFAPPSPALPHLTPAPSKSSHFVCVPQEVSLRENSFKELKRKDYFFSNFFPFILFQLFVCEMK